MGRTGLAGGLLRTQRRAEQSGELRATGSLSSGVAPCGFSGNGGLDAVCGDCGKNECYVAPVHQGHSPFQGQPTAGFILLQRGDDPLHHGVGDAVAHPGPLAPAGDDAPVLEQRQVLGNRCLGQPQTLPDILDIALFGAQPGRYLEPYRMTEHLQDFRFLAVVSCF